MLIVMGIASLTFHFVGTYQKRKKPRSPLTCDVLRGPGHTHSGQIIELGQDLQVCQIALFTLPLLALATHAAYSYFARVPESWVRILVSAGTALLFMAYYAWKLMRLLAARRLCRLRFDGEVTVGQELNLLMSDGYRVFHDFPADSFKIDHIVIGSTGVMVVETKTRGHNRQADAVVAYDGRMLHFPKRSDHETIDQANLKAEWISEWLSSATGEDVCARAMVAVPGWSVKRTSADGIPVVNPKQFATLFKYIKPRPMTDGLMQHIVKQIEGRCRDVAPLASN
jgi:hypothetical protein